MYTFTLPHAFFLFSHGHFTTKAEETAGEITAEEKLIAWAQEHGKGGSRGGKPGPCYPSRRLETDNLAKGFLTCLYCIYFTSWGRIVHFVSVLCVFCVCNALFTFLRSAHCQPACDSLPVARNRHCAYSMSRSENRDNLNTMVKPWLNWF